MTEIIVGEKVVLRPIEMGDTEKIVRWRNNPKVKNNFIFRDTFTNEMHEAWMNNKVVSGEVIQYIIEEKDTGKPVGSVYFRDINVKYKSAEYGIFIGEDDARGKGIGTEATKLFVDFGLKKIGLHRISLRVLSENKQAYSSYKSAGFKEEGLFRDMVRLDGKYCDVIFMSVLDE